MERIPVSGPSITQKEIEYVAQAAETAWYSQANVFNDRFEKAFADYVGVDHAVSLPSCTSAIHLALAALGIGPGDEVIVPDVTWIATAAPVSYVGATPVFADVNPASWCITPQAIKAVATERTRAVIPVDIYGGMPDMDSVLEAARSLGLAVIEDAAEAIGSRYKNLSAGSFGDVGVFSFHGSKTMTTGEGGMLVTNDEELYRRVLFLRDHGRPPGDRFFHNTQIAFKYKMSSLQAAMGLAQIERIEELVERKREIFFWYKQCLGSDSRITLNAEPEHVRNSFWMVTAILEDNAGLEKREIMERMSQKSVDTRPFFSPLSSLPAYDKFPSALEAQTRNKVAYTVSKSGINLPSGLNLDQQTVEMVCELFLECLG